MTIAMKTIVSIALAVLSLSLSSCKKPEPESPDENIDPPMVETPATPIPDEFVGTWYKDDNEGPLTTNWEKGTFQGEQGFREFRTMVFTKDGKNAIEYTTQIYNVGTSEKKYVYRYVGTLEYQSNPAMIRFHAQSGRVRLFLNNSTTYQEAAADLEMVQAYYSVLRRPETTSTGEVLDARRFDGGNEYSVRYKKASAAVPPTNTDQAYASPPASGTYVKVGNQYYPTVTIGGREWMSVNYAGPGGKLNTAKIEYGTFIQNSELSKIPVPAGWRIPTKEDYFELLRSQGLVVSEWGSTDGADVASKRKLGHLMSKTGWKKQDGYADNASGFNAVPANYKTDHGTNPADGMNCVLWTSERNEYDTPLAFEIIQLPSDTYSKITQYPTGYYPPLIPVRLVKIK